MHPVRGYRYVVQRPSIGVWLPLNHVSLKVAVDRTSPNGRVLGIDIIPAQPPKGASTIQGNFLSPSVQEEVKGFLRDPTRGRPRVQIFLDGEGAEELSEDEVEESELGYIDLERHATREAPDTGQEEAPSGRLTKRQKEESEGRMVDVVLSDMSEPWEQTTGFWKRSLSAPYSRMMNTSGINFRDHAGSMVGGAGMICLWGALKCVNET